MFIHLINTDGQTAAVSSDPVYKLLMFEGHSVLSADSSLPLVYLGDVQSQGMCWFLPVTLRVRLDQTEDASVPSLSPDKLQHVLANGPRERTQNLTQDWCYLRGSSDWC